MQNKKRFIELYDEIMKSHYILVVLKDNPRVDTIASALSLSNYFFENKIKHKVFSSSSVLPRKLEYLVKFNKIVKDIPKYYDLVIYLDCSSDTTAIIGSNLDIKSISITTAELVDNCAEINITDSTKSSTAELLYSFFKVNNLKISKNVAECLYTGIYYNSSGLTTAQTTVQTFDVVRDLLNSNIDVSSICDKLLKTEPLSKFRIVPKVLNTLELFYEGELATIYLDDIWLIETGATKEQCDDIIEQVLNIGIVKVCLYFRVIEDSIKVSLRSKRDIDLTKIALFFNGIKNQNCIDFFISSKTIEEVKKDVVKTIRNYI